jgi:Pyridoxamine 5'-phosphate oxidase
MSEPMRRRPSFGGGYGVPTGEEGMLEWAWAEERLVAAHNYWVATAGPHASPVWGLWQDGGFLFSCGSRSRKARALVVDPHIVVHLESGAEVVIVEGVAGSASATERDVEAYEAKYDYRPSAGEGWYRVAPKRAFAWREADYPRSATRFDFRDR